MASRSGVYQPEELMLFRRIFEECLRALPESKRAAVNQARIARQLMACAATGERNPVELRIAARPIQNRWRRVARSTQWTPEQIDQLKKLVGSFNQFERI